MLGLGDIVIPGIFVAMCLRYDAAHGSSYFRRYLEMSPFSVFMGFSIASHLQCCAV